MSAQTDCGGMFHRQFSKAELVEDLVFIKTKIENAHANPYTKLSKLEFDQKFNELESQLVDGMTQRQFYDLVQPVFTLLNDEHAGMEHFCVPDSLKGQFFKSTDIKIGPSETPERLNYKTYGDIGYFTVNSFEENSLYTIDYWTEKIDSIFGLIQKDKVKELVIDVRDNGGGNSQFGDVLIGYFSDKPYSTYSGTWRRSQEYADFLKGFGYVDSLYETIPNGESYVFQPWIMEPEKNAKRFNGKTTLVIGMNTFSSAMMFATIILDNNLAEVVGEVPLKGHPNHFGELIGFETAHTELEFWFGVKEWIRPSGSYIPHELIPNRIIALSGKSREEVIAEIRGGR